MTAVLDVSKMATFPPMSIVVGPHMFAYEALFKKADARGKGSVGAAQAVNFLKQSGLKESVLKQIWDLADPSGKGFLDKQGFFVALKLIAVVQNGKEASLANIGLPVPLPDMGTSGSPAPPTTTNSTGPPWAIPLLGICLILLSSSCFVPASHLVSPLSAHPKSDVAQAARFQQYLGLFPSSSVYPFPHCVSKVKEKAKYDQIFDGLGPVNGLLQGDRVKPVLLNSKLPTDILGRVWDLSDIDSDGYLDREEFAVAMHLVYKALQKQPVPSVLPVEMVPPSKRKRFTSCSDSSPTSSATSVKSSTVVTNNNTDGSRSKPEWFVSPQAKAQYEELFNKTDTDKDGYVSGTEIKGIFLKSGLPQSVLAHIWSLCDMRGIGKLNRDQFALAMYFIQQKLKGIDPPAKLPPELIPQSVRRRSLVDGAVPSGLSIDYNSPGMKELDQLGNEIEKLKSEKLVLDEEKAKVEADIQSCAEEMSTLEQELETVLAAGKQLEMQKTEAQKRLNELDSKKVNLETILKENNDRLQEEQQQVIHLREQLTNQDSMDKVLEENLRSKRDELNQLRQKELELELKVETGHSRLVQLSKLVHGTQVNINQAEYNITKLEEAEKSIAQTIGLYDSMLNDEMSEDEAMRMGSLAVTSPLALDLSLSTLDAMSDIVQMTNTELESLQDKLITLPTGITEADEVADIVEGGGNYEDTVAPPGADPFGEALASVEQASQETTKVEDPWTSAAFANAKPPATNDPFYVGTIAELKSPINPEDPFGTGMFAPPGLEDVKKQMSLHPSDKKSGPPPRPKSPSAPGRPKSPAPPKRPKSPVPPRPRSPAPPGRPKSPAPPSKQKKGPPPPRPPAPAKSPLPPGQDCPESQNGGEAMTFPMTSDVGHDFVDDFNTNTYSTDDTTAWLEQ